MSSLSEIPKAQREVWDWKDAAYRSVAHLPREEALRTLLRNADAAAKTFGIAFHPLRSSHPARVAERPAEYRAARQPCNDPKPSA